MCFLKDDGCVYDLSQPGTRQLYGLSDVCTCECFFLSDELAKRRSHPSCSHLNGFSPAKSKEKVELIKSSIKNSFSFNNSVMMISLDQMIVRVSPTTISHSTKN